jgi:hypothetical protein
MELNPSREDNSSPDGQRIFHFSATENIPFLCPQQPTAKIDETQSSHHISFGIMQLEEVAAAIIK